MNKVYTVSRTDKSPEIYGDMVEGKIKIEGVSIPENSKEFYEPFYRWMVDFLTFDHEKIVFDVDLQYFNTSTSIFLLDVFKKLSAFKKGADVQINWYYEEDDLDILESGEDYKMMVGDILKLCPKNIHS